MREGKLCAFFVALWSVVDDVGGAFAVFSAAADCVSLYGNISSCAYVYLSPGKGFRVLSGLELEFCPNNSLGLGLRFRALWVEEFGSSFSKPKGFY